MTKRKKRKIRRIMISVLLAALFLAMILSLPVIFKIKGYRDEALRLVSGCSEEDFRATQTTVAYDADGNVLMTMRAAKDMYYVTYDSIPQAVKDSFIIMEDRKFFSHRGIDYLGIVRAMIANRRSDGIEQGASTITQQLARNVFLTQEVTWSRKITEMFVATELEKKFKKEQILEFYINNIYFANGFYGIEAASRGYFNKSVDELSLSEMVFLTAIPNNPNRYDPADSKEKTLKRRDLILSQLYEGGKINTVNYYEAVEEEIDIDIQKSGYNDYIDTYVRRCATESLMKAQGFVFRNNFESEESYNEYCEGYDRAYGRCQRMLFGGGYSIYTSIDTKKQALLQEAVDNAAAGNTEVNSEGIYALQAAAVCIDNATGNVVAIVGGRSQEHDGYTLNRAYQSYRQPGSSIKPLNVYTPYLQLGATPDTIVTDELIKDGPVNADGMYAGDMTLRDAVRFSKNTVAWKIYEKITPKAGNSFLMRLGFKKVYVDSNKTAGSLGGFTYGVTAEEMAGAYAAIENDGIYREATCITGITTIDGNNVIDNSTRGSGIFDGNSCRMMTDMLKTVMESGTGRDAAVDNAVTAGKTGTTNDNKDSWLAGFSRYYTTAVWVGYDMPRMLKGDVNVSKVIWHDFMQEIHEGLPKLPFAQYSDTKDSASGQQQETSTGESKTEETSFEMPWDPDMPTEQMTAEDTAANGSAPAGGESDASVGGLGDGYVDIDASGLGDSSADISNYGDRDR